MSSQKSCSNRSQSVMSESEKTPTTQLRSCRSDLGVPRVKPIKRAKFLTRKQVMFRYMERVEKINNRLREMQKQKQMQRVLSQKQSQKKATVHHLKIKIASKNSNHVQNIAI
jgi:hypothetical protein